MESTKSQPPLECILSGALRNILSDAYACMPEVGRSRDWAQHLKRQFAKDVETLESRVQSEGLGFFTKTLPKLGKAFDKALETGCLIVPNEFSRKRKSGERWNIPAFMSELFAAIFEPISGILDPCRTFAARVSINVHGSLGWYSTRAILAIRQVCYLAYKLEIPLKDGLAQDVLGRFHGCRRFVAGNLIRGYKARVFYLGWLRSNAGYIPGELTYLDSGSFQEF